MRRSTRAAPAREPRPTGSSTARAAESAHDSYGNDTAAESLSGADTAESISASKVFRSNIGVRGRGEDRSRGTSGVARLTASGARGGDVRVMRGVSSGGIAPDAPDDPKNSGS